MSEEFQPENAQDLTRSGHSTDFSKLTAMELLEDFNKRAIDLDSHQKRELISRLRVELSDSSDSSDTENESNKLRLKGKSKKNNVNLDDFMHRRGGIVYVAPEHWVNARHAAQFCHLYVSTISPENKKDGLGKTSVPDRLRIMNNALREEMARIRGVEYMDCDHVVPYRSIVPFEQAFRQAYKEKDKEFQDRVAKIELYELTKEQDEAVEKNPFVLSSYNVEYQKSDTKFLKIVQSAPDEWELLEFSELKHVRNGLHALVQLLDTDLKELVHTHQQIANGTYEINDLPFSHLWYLFQPGTTIISTKPKEQVYRVLQACGGRPVLADKDGNSISYSLAGRGRITDLVIDCFYLDFDGKQFRPVPKKIVIQPYEGRCTITSLPACPLKLWGEETRRKMVERGKTFAQLTEVAHKKYQGLSIKEGDSFHNYEEVDGDVIIDFELAFRNSRPKIEQPKFEEGVIILPSQEDSRETRDPHGISFDDSDLVQQLRLNFVNNTTLLDPQPAGELGEERWILLPYRVYGYVLLSRKWLPLDVELVQDLIPVKAGELDGFADLVLPEGHKDIVRALVITHSRATTTKGENIEKKREFDLVKGKGKGLIILLHGAPGVGKTSTAECVATNTGRPLFPITCGDIGGDSAQEVERNLESFFDLARKWGCVLLLDEADVFLAERSKGDIRQNSLVSVFLRVLEYYSGILILTTNRVGEFDEAIKSRVHCALYYPPLTRDYTMNVWKLNLDRLERQNHAANSTLPVKFFRPEIMKFAKAHWKDGNHWNGRQIKNAFQTAIALADWDYQQRRIEFRDECPLLTSAHFQKVAEASVHFERYLMSVRTSDEQRAKAQELRHDGFLDQPRKQKQESVRAPSTRKPKWPTHPDSWSSDSASETDDDIDLEMEKKVARWKKDQARIQQEQQLKAYLAKKAKKEQREAMKMGKLLAENEWHTKDQELGTDAGKKKKGAENGLRVVETEMLGKGSSPLGLRNSDLSSDSY